MIGKITAAPIGATERFSSYSAARPSFGALKQEGVFKHHMNERFVQGDKFISAKLGETFKSIDKMSGNTDVYVRYTGFEENDTDESYVMYVKSQDGTPVVFAKTPDLGKSIYSSKLPEDKISERKEKYINNLLKSFVKSQEGGKVYAAELVQNGAAKGLIENSEKNIRLISSFVNNNPLTANAFSKMAENIQHIARNEGAVKMDIAQEDDNFIFKITYADDELIAQKEISKDAYSDDIEQSIFELSEEFNSNVDPNRLEE